MGGLFDRQREEEQYSAGLREGNIQAHYEDCRFKEICKTFKEYSSEREEALVEMMEAADFSVQEALKGKGVFFRGGFYRGRG